MRCGVYIEPGEIDPWPGVDCYGAQKAGEEARSGGDGGAEEEDVPDDAEHVGEEEERGAELVFVGEEGERYEGEAADSVDLNMH